MVCAYYAPTNYFIFLVSLHCGETTFWQSERSVVNTTDRFSACQRPPSLTRWQAVKKEVAFRQQSSVGVRGYGRERIGGKQRKPLQRKGSLCLDLSDQYTVITICIYC